MEIEDAIECRYLKPASELRLSVEQEDDYERGLVYEKVREVLTRAHVVSAQRVDLIEERAAHARYLLLPSKFSFPKTVRIYSIMTSFLS